jgi:sensor c-di-GMP phosphodiesterase-like protein
LNKPCILAFDLRGAELPADYFEANAQPVLAQGWLFGHPVPAEQFHRDWKEKTRLEREPAGLV